VSRSELEVWVERHYAELVAVARRRVTTDPEDVVQATVLSSLTTRSYVRCRAGAAWTWFVHAVEFSAGHARTGEARRRRMRDADAEHRAARRRVLNPEQSAECTELLDRVPTEITALLVDLEGVRSNNTIGRTRQRVLRREAMRYARIAVALLAALVFGAAAPAVAGQATLTFTDNAPNPATPTVGLEDGFLIERVVVASPTACTPTTIGFVQIGVAPANLAPAPSTVTYVDTTVTEKLAYCYRVRATNAGGNSEYTSPAGGVVNPTVPAQPSNLLFKSP